MDEEYLEGTEVGHGHADSSAEPPVVMAAMDACEAVFRLSVMLEECEDSEFRAAVSRISRLLQLCADLPLRDVDKCKPVGFR